MASEACALKCVIGIKGMSDTVLQGGGGGGGGGVVVGGVGGGGVVIKMSDTKTEENIR